jgi:hypothetical protein
MKIKKLTKENYKEWDRFCENSRDAWFWHTSEWLEYNLHYRPDLNGESESFFIERDGEIICVCPLIIETADTSKFTFGQDYGPWPAFSDKLSKNERESVMKVVFNEIDKIAKEGEVKVVKMRTGVLNLNYLENNRNNILMKFGFIDTSLQTQVLDLSKSLKELRQEVRHGHDSDIDKAFKVLKAEVYDEINITEEVFNKYVEMHNKAAGRVTRPKITFDMMFDWICEGIGFLVAAKKDNKFVGFSYFFCYKGCVYYGSSCNDPEIREVPVGHLIQWRAIEYMKSKNLRFYELGWQIHSKMLSHPSSEKELHIGRFKRGFGGITIPLFRGEKYYDRDYFLRIYNQRVKNFGESI